MIHKVEQSRPFSQNQHVVLLLVNPNLGTPQADARTLRTTRCWTQTSDRGWLMVRFPATSLPQMIRVAKEEGRIRSCQLTRSKLPRPSHFHTSLLVKRRSLSLRPLLQSTDWGLSDLFRATSFKADDQDGWHEEGIKAHTDDDQGGFKTRTHKKRGSLSKLRSATAFKVGGSHIT